MLHVALWEPEIPPNTGNIARLCAATGTRLHLIGRLGFRLDDRSLRRAGLDYWPAVDVVRHVTFEDFERALYGEGQPNPPAPFPKKEGGAEPSAVLSPSLLRGGVGERSSAFPRIWCVETPNEKLYTRADFVDGDCLLFGSESSGLPHSVRERFAERLIGIPMPTGAVRSLNLATAVGIVLYDALRRQHGW
ncbi:tRNA (cytidine(34)-2'-O)-methyltransferase [Gemmata sp. SH-PL17]|uniref:tRNA (cytidine(34)-2'-O)-methyltransferase n=1 Tax=Gemmata sp. SH-PL17 TaxID=1630693 RepID=UPI00078CF989|nr:tRNA (cytidine(34)-2'-O)-methyltransferase [Gemmata sp. SH-PL17]AMV23190.1 tRNA (cytidine(34)-2'-O)-methyltransferase [Gemmata sp. SH-PL17]